MSKVQLYVYDLSNGMAKQMSLPLTGKQIDGIWHTSVVVFGKEVFYGQGINSTAPGRSHHGSPLQAIDMGETALDEETFDEYLTEMSDHYTADKYHLLDFNCNSFTNDCIGFLTGNTIPSWIKDLPSDFLATDFGRALRPTIDNMYRGPNAGAIPTPPPEAAAGTLPNLQMTPALLQAVAARAAGGMNNTGPSNYLPTPSATPTPASSTVASPIQIATNPSSFNSILRSHRAVVSFFTSATCGPCQFIEPTFEELAHEKTRGAGGGKIAFVKIERDVGMSNQVGAEYSIRATPTFIMFLDGKQTHEMTGVNVPELKSQVDLLLYEAFPPHPHTSLSLPAIGRISTDPILFKQVTALDAVQNKLSSFIDASTLTDSAKQTAKDTLLTAVLPFLKSRFSPSGKSVQMSSTTLAPLLASWVSITADLLATLPPAEVFPVIDMWRLALMDGAVSAWCAANLQPIDIFLAKAATTTPPRNYVLTLLRMLSNAFATTILAQRVLRSGKTRDDLTSFLITNLLNEEASVRTAAASLAFNVAASIQQTRVNTIRDGLIGASDEGDGDWEVELISAIVEAIQREESEEVVHRLVACLAFLIRFAPGYQSDVVPLLEVLQTKGALLGKLVTAVKKSEVKQLVQEVATKLCP